MTETATVAVAETDPVRMTEAATVAESVPAAGGATVAVATIGIACAATVAVAEIVPIKHIRIPRR
jgi:hypothetical protein